MMPAGIDVLDIGTCSRSITSIHHEPLHHHESRHVGTATASFLLCCKVQTE